MYSQSFQYLGPFRFLEKENGGKKTFKKHHVAVANIILDTEVSDSAFCPLCGQDDSWIVVKASITGSNLVPPNHTGINS